MTQHDETTPNERPSNGTNMNAPTSNGMTSTGTTSTGMTPNELTSSAETPAFTEPANLTDASAAPAAGADVTHAAPSDPQADLPPKKKRSRAKKIALWVLGIIVGLVLVVLVGFNIYIRMTYAAFYDQATEEFEIPGIHAGFICQDLDYYDEAGCWFFSGYAAGDGASPLYRRDADGSSVEFFAQLPDGSPYTGHGSGISTSRDHAFLTCDNGYLVFDASDLAQVAAGESVRAIDQVDLELTPAFLNIENDTLYVGTFHLLPNYAAPEHHHHITPDGTENAGLLLAYPAVNAKEAAPGATTDSDANDQAAARYGFSAQAAYAISLPDKVQGVCVLPNGDMTLSTSYGFNTSRLITYRLSAGHADAARDATAQRSLSFDAMPDGSAEDGASAANDAGTSGISAATNAADPAGNSAAASISAALAAGTNSPYTFFVDGRSVPLYFLDSMNLVSEIEAPPMTEGIEFHDGRIWISEESASNKYIFGKLYGAGDVFSLPAAAFATGE